MSSYLLSGLILPINGETAWYTPKGATDPVDPTTLEIEVDPINFEMDVGVEDEDIFSVIFLGRDEEDEESLLTFLMEEENDANESVVEPVAQDAQESVIGAISYMLNKKNLPDIDYFAQDDLSDLFANITGHRMLPDLLDEVEKTDDISELIHLVGDVIFDQMDASMLEELSKELDEVLESLLTAGMMFAMSHLFSLFEEENASSMNKIQDSLLSLLAPDSRLVDLLEGFEDSDMFPEISIILPFEDNEEDVVEEADEISVDIDADIPIESAWYDTH